MIWEGESPLVVGVVGAGGVKEEIVVQPGEELPARAVELLKDARLQRVPYPGVYTRARVRAAFSWARRAERAQGEGA